MRIEKTSGKYMNKCKLTKTRIVHEVVKQLYPAELTVVKQSKGSGASEKTKKMIENDPLSKTFSFSFFASIFIYLFCLLE